MSIVITTINYPTEAIKVLSEKETDNINLIVVGDKKTPKDWSARCVFLPYDEPNNFSVSKFIPDNHYSRKNIGYLTAIYNGAKSIYDTDDDNIPNENWKEREYDILCIGSVGNGWYNVYKLCSNNFIWPRGFSLTHLHKNEPSVYFTTYRKSSIQQGLSNQEADVDAMFRLIHNYKITFNKHGSIFLNRGSWCPFNSQSTWWFPKAYPLMYLPVTATMRCTDIWRSFIAQRCLWEIGEGVTFHSPAEVTQVRNPHDLLKDFEDEIPGYLNNDRIVEILSNITLSGDVCENLLHCYKQLSYAGIFPMHEVRSVNAWIKDIKQIWKP